jgi:NifB/MoaA-like Fe-S oxidoreductase
VEKHSHRISGTKPGSIACEMGIEPGDSLLTINGEQVFDIIDYLEWNSHEKLEVIICKSNGEEWILEIEKESDEDLGIIFQEPLMDSLKSIPKKSRYKYISLKIFFETGTYASKY